MGQFKKPINKGKGRKLMKKMSLILALVMAMLLTVSLSAYAAQNRTSETKGTTYKETPKTTSVAYPDGIYLQDKDKNGAADNIHSGYQRNTDACASCHATHTAPGPYLLQWNSVQATCEACHDGTITETYNVEEGYISGTTGTRTMGGLFGTATANDDPNNVSSLSKHNTGEAAIKISAAPGGDFTATDAKWAKGFECMSCHEPHGKGGNYRILNPDVNGMAEQKNLTLTKSASDPLTYEAGIENGNWLSGFNYPVIVSDSKVPRTAITSIDLAKGTVTFASAPVEPVTASVKIGIKVTGTVTSKLSQTEVATYNEGMNKYCGACHTDYDTSVTTDRTSMTSFGTYSMGYRHKFGGTWSKASFQKELTFGGPVGGTNRELTCLTCHVAHGVDDQWWADWKTKTGWQGTLADTTGTDAAIASEDSGTSALKRLPNMATCEACHAQGVANYQYTKGFTP